MVKFLAKRPMQDFTKLHVWRRALHLAIDIDRQARRFPRAGYGWLASQMRRSSASVGANIAEGCGQRSRRELARFLQVAMASASESQHHITFAKGIGLISTCEHERLTSELTQLRRMLSALQRRVQQQLTTDDSALTTKDSLAP